MNDNEDTKIIPFRRREGTEKTADSTERIPEPAIERPELDVAHAQTMRMFIQEIRTSGINTNCFTHKWLEDGVLAAKNFTPYQAIAILNKSVREQWEEAPSFYLALDEIVKGQALGSESDE
ncbi:MAG: hypothetical protein Q8O19_00145 [Rectinemataceae bacterium]|nr:hypothetical protein [Rectinemataceae bacterium]